MGRTAVIFQPITSYSCCALPYSKSSHATRAQSHRHWLKGHMKVTRLPARNGNMNMNSPHSFCSPKPPVLAVVSMRELTIWYDKQESGNEEALKLPSDNHSGLHFWMFGLSRTADVRIIKFKTAGKAKWPIREWIKTAIYKQDARQFCWAPQYSKYQGSSPPWRAFQF